ncbi:hypothetical protein ACLOJK_022285 [Asimina triloba]
MLLSGLRRRSMPSCISTRHLTVGTTKLLARLQHKPRVHSSYKRQKLNSILSRYARSNHPRKALLLLGHLQQRKDRSSAIDSFTILHMLKACTKTSSMTEGKQVHSLVVKLGFESIIFIQTALINVYSTAGRLEDAHHMFDEIFPKNVVCWTALISAYVDNGRPNTALDLFRRMQLENVEPDPVTVTILLSACTHLGALHMGAWIHSYIARKNTLKWDLCLKNALINMYAKCGNIETARKLFDAMSQRDVMTWTSMIVGHALHGQAEEALRLFAEMKDKRNAAKNDNTAVIDLVIPNEVTFIGVLMACSHAGRMEEGLQHLESMNEDYHLKPQVSHYGCIVTLYCRAGLVEEAYAFMQRMPIPPNAVLLRTVLGACSLFGKVELGERIRHKLLELEPNFTSDIVTMSNMYASAGMWLEKSLVRKEMKKQRRDPGCSLIEVEGRVHEFVAADRKHPLKREICGILEGLINNLRAAGYDANSFIWVDDVSREEA